MNKYIKSLKNYIRFRKDVRYNLEVPPQGIAYGKMSKKTAKEAFEWYIDAIPRRMAYFRKRCSDDLRIPIETLDYSAESLIPVWRWFLQTARTEDTPEEELAWMLEGAKIFGESFISRKVLTVATQFIVRDISMYVGECFLKESPKLYWTYRDKPKDSVTVNQPVIAGLISKKDEQIFPMVFAPIHMVGVQAGKVLTNETKETDLYNVYQFWRKYIPKE